MGFGGGGSDINQIYERNQEATVYVGNLDSRVDEELLWEIFTQAGPVKNVHTPRDKITGQHSNFGFVEFQLESDADYSMKIFNMVKLYGKPLRCNKAAQDKRTLEVGANLFIGNLDPDVDESLLFETFSTFGNVLSTKIMRDPETGEHRGFGFISFDAFEHSDAALAAMNGQFLCNRPIHVSYAYKRDTKGERHGSTAERLIAANRHLGLKDQQQQAVLSNVMSSMMNSMLTTQQRQQQAVYGAPGVAPIPPNLMGVPGINPGAMLPPPPLLRNAGLPMPPTAMGMSAPGILQSPAAGRGGGMIAAPMMAAGMVVPPVAQRPPGMPIPPTLMGVAPTGSGGGILPPPPPPRAWG